MTSPEAHSLETAATSQTTPVDTRRLAELAAAVAARDNFIAVAAHELRNPMTPMIGQIELLLLGMKAGRFTPAQIEERLENIHRVMTHYLKRAATLLDISRITSGKLRLEPSPCDLADVVREVADTFAEAARHAGAAIEIQALASLPGTWDRLAVEQILDNLVSNAIKYAGGNRVIVRAENTGNGSVLIQVRDFGPGISQEDRARIFGRFERVVGLSERHSGFGVGLWVAGQLVDAMGGTITVDDAEGGGAVFNVTLPKYQLAASHD